MINDYSTLKLHVASVPGKPVAAVFMEADSIKSPVYVCDEYTQLPIACRNALKILQNFSPDKFPEVLTLDEYLIDGDRIMPDDLQEFIKKDTPSGVGSIGDSSNLDIDVVGLIPENIAMGIGKNNFLFDFFLYYTHTNQITRADSNRIMTMRYTADEKYIENYPNMLYVAMWYLLGGIDKEFNKKTEGEENNINMT